jgi:hypothetical protein
MTITQRAAGTRRYPSALRAAGAVGALLIMTACAATSPQGTPVAATSGQAATTSGQAAAVPQSNPSCMTQTASQAAASGTNCTGPGESFTNDDIRRTGATLVGPALPILDPAITVHH